MPQELGLQAVAALVEKGGMVGLLLVAISYLIYERLRLMKDNRRVYKQRDKARMICERYRGAITAASIAVPDITDIITLFGDGEDH